MGFTSLFYCRQNAKEDPTPRDDGRIGSGFSSCNRVSDGIHTQTLY